ncbi:MAG: GGDEF domain-containing protein [Spirochaetales bacterium]|nr:GGDEF domain-containing protein [Spirochaetales bacterium]
MVDDKLSFSDEEIKKLKEENETLSNQVKRLIKTEYILYNTQIHLDEQIELYKSLYAIGKKFSNTLDIKPLFHEMGDFILEHLNYGAFIIMQKQNGYYSIFHKKGDFDIKPEEFKLKFEIELIQQLFQDLTFNDEHVAFSNPKCVNCHKRLGLKDFVLYILDTKNINLPEYFVIVGNPEYNEFFSQIDINDTMIIGLSNLVSFVINSINNIYHYQELMKERQYLEEKVDERTKDLNVAMEELRRLNSKLHFISVKDELTGLYNRRGFISIGNEYFSIAQKNKSSLLIVYCDLDGLKKINDTYGHQEGDFAINQTGVLLTKIFRKTDIISRFGGDEYVVLLDNGSDKYIDEIKKRLKYLFMEYNANSCKEYELSISIGCVFFDFKKSNVSNFEELIAMADEILYQEKHKKKKQTDN